MGFPKSSGDGRYSDVYTLPCMSDSGCVLCFSLCSYIVLLAAFYLWVSIVTIMKRYKNGTSIKQHITAGISLPVSPLTKNASTRQQL